MKLIIKKFIKKKYKLFFGLLFSSVFLTTANYKDLSNKGFQNENEFNFLFLAKKHLQNNLNKFTSKNYLEEEIINKITSGLNEANKFFESKFNKASNEYPSNTKEWTDLNITFILKKITTKSSSNKWYPIVINYLTKIIKYNFLNKIFFYEIKDLHIPSNIFPFKKYLESQRSSQKLEIDNDKSIPNFVINTLSEAEIKKNVDEFLKSFSAYLLSDNSNKNKFGLNWYDSIPEQLKPKKDFNKPIDDQYYQNLIDAIFTKKNGSTIIESAGLTTQQTNVENELKTQFDLDKQKLKELTSETKSNLFIDKTPDILFEALKIINKKDIDDLQKEWNLSFSNIKNIFLNKDKLNSNLITYQKLKINYLKKQSLDWILGINNAILNGNYSFNNYSSNVSTSAESILNEVIKMIKKQGIDKYYDLNFALKINSHNLIENNELKKLKSIIPLDFSVIDVSPWSSANQFSVKVRASLGSTELGLTTKVFGGPKDYDFLYQTKKTIEEFELENALELTPFLNPTIKIKSTLEATAWLNKINNTKDLNYLNTNKNLDYQAQKVKIIEPNLIITNEIKYVGKYTTNKTKIYQTKIPLVLFTPSNFDKLPKEAANKVDKNLKATYGPLYDQAIDQKILDKIYKNALDQTKLSPEFLKNTDAKNLEFFLKLYEQNLKDKILDKNINDKQKTIDQINQYYDGIKERLTNSLIRAGIDLKSTFAKSLYDEIEIARKKALENLDSNLKPSFSQKFLDIVDYVNDENNNVNKFKAFAKLLENYKPHDILLALNKAEKNTIFSFTGISILVLLSSLILIYRGSKIDVKKYQLKKMIFIGLGIGMLLISLGGLGYLLSLIAAF